jgi:glycosyltransferase involved in cell wall biosynthesis
VADRPPGSLSIAYLGDPNSIHLRRWAGYFARLGHRVTLLIADGLEVQPGLAPEIAVERFVPFYHRRPRIAGMFDARRSLRRVLRQIRPDVLDAQYLTVNGWHAWMSGFHPYVVSVWGSDVFVTPRTSRRGAMFARLPLRSADLVVAGSASLMEAAISLGARRDRAVTIASGVDRTSFRPGPASPALRGRLGLEGRHVLFSPRAMKPLYRHGVVVDALTRLPDDVVALMVSYMADPTELSAVQRRAEELGVADRVVIVPAIAHSDMPDFYRLADVVVSLPASDSTPITLFEALACERPVVAADLPAVRELLGRLDPGALVPVDDPAQTATAIARALDRGPAERAALATQGVVLVEEMADQDRNLARVEKLYRGLAAKRSGYGSRGGDGAATR